MMDVSIHAWLSGYSSPRTVIYPTSQRGISRDSHDAAHPPPPTATTLAHGPHCCAHSRRADTDRTVVPDRGAPRDTHPGGGGADAEVWRRHRVGSAGQEARLRVSYRGSGRPSPRISGHPGGQSMRARTRPRGPPCWPRGSHQRGGALRGGDMVAVCAPSKSTGVFLLGRAFGCFCVVILGPRLDRVNKVLMHMCMLYC